MKVVIIGGVAAGTKAAAKIMREEPQAEVDILTKDDVISYAGCGLPYYVGGIIENFNSLIVNTPQKFEALTRAKVHTSAEVLGINKDTKTVKAADTLSGEKKEYTYDKLIIASGASPIIPKVNGRDLKNVFYMRTPSDAAALRAAAKSGEMKRAAVCGAGLIGLETAENLATRGIKTTVIDMAPHILPGFDPEITDYIERYLADKGISCMTSAKLLEITGTDKVERVLTDKRAIKADAVVLALGIRPNTSFLKDSGIEMAPNGTIRTDSEMRTNIPDIYAVGDCASVRNIITGKEAWSPMGSSANMEGRVAALNMTGEKKHTFKGVLGTGICRLIDLNIGKSGLSEKAARAAGYDAVSAVTVTDDKAHYYPGATQLMIKIIADKKTEKMLGLQVIGKGSTDKITDISAVALTLGAKIRDLVNMDLAYAPPFATAIHPFTQALNVLINKMEYKMDSITPLEYINSTPDAYKLLDVSLQPKLKNAPYFDYTKGEESIPGFTKGDKILLVCAKGKRAYLTQLRLKKFGYTKTKVLEGGHTFNEIKEDND